MNTRILIATACSALLLSLAGPGMAHNPNKDDTDDVAACVPVEKEKPEKPEKVRIAHCGCNADGSDLVWKHIQVSTRAIGHLKHLASTEERPKQVGCLNAEETAETLRLRAAGDCRLVEEGNTGEIRKGDRVMPDCAIPSEGLNPMIGASCGAEVVAQPI